MIRRWLPSTLPFRPVMFALFGAILALGPGLLVAAAPIHGVEGGDEATYNKVGLSIFKGLRRGLEAVERESKENPYFEATLNAAFLDARSRAFYHMTGEVRVPPEKASPRFQRTVQKLEGYSLTTNGALSVDLVVPEVFRDDQQRVLGFTFDLTVTCVTSKVAETVAAYAIKVGTIGLFSFLAGGVVPFFENFNADLVGRAVSNGVTDTVYFVATDGIREGGWQLAGGNDEALKAQRQDRLVRFFGKGITLGAIFRYVGDLIKGLVHSASYRAVGAGVGAIIAATLFPAGGAFVGGVLAAVVLPILGDVVTRWVTEDIPTWWTLRRLRAAYEESAMSGESDPERDEKIEKWETRLLEHIDTGIRTEDYSFFDRLVARLEKHDAAGRQLMMPLIQKVRARLSMAVLGDENWVAARKYYQLLGALGIDPASP